MRVVIAVDWSDQAFNAIQVTCRLFTPEELTLVHAVDTRSFESPLTAPPIAKEVATELRHTMIDAGERLLRQSSELVPSTIPSIRSLYQIGNPTDVILDTARSANADLVSIGCRGRGPVAELFLGSVSHRVVQHSSSASLIVRSDPKQFRQIVIAIEGEEDALRIREWLSTHRLAEAAEFTVLSVVPTTLLGEPAATAGYSAWTREMEKYACEQVERLAEALRPIYKIAKAQVVKGDAADEIARASQAAQLLVIGSHGRRGMERFLLGSVSHAVLHQVTCPVLVIR